MALRFVAGIAVLVWGVGCSSGPISENAPPVCDLVKEGCACDNPGDVLACGELESLSQTTASCMMGDRICQPDRTWSACSRERATKVSLKRDTQSLGTFGKCAEMFDDCDPDCHITTDTAGDFNAGTGFKNTTSGVTLDGTVKLNCNSLSLTPSANTVTLSGSSINSLSAPNVTFTLTASPAACVGPNFAVTWIVDRFDRATISGTTNSNGVMKVAVPIAGTIQVTALAAGITASTNIQVKVNVLDVPANAAAAAPNTAASSSRATTFGTLASPALGSGTSTASWLYPYAGTYFPLALPPPVLQYLYTRASGDSTTAASAVKISLRYPAGSTAATSKFNYSLIVNENNSVACAEDSGSCNFIDPQIALPKDAWRYFELSARGQDASLSIQRLREKSSGNPTLETETTRTIHFVDGQLKGTVYYNSYTSPQAGNTGAILAIQPGATTPELAVSPSGTCVTCHTVDLTGTQLISNGAKTGGTYSFDTSKAYNMKTAGPSPTTTATFTDNKFTFGAPWLDGKYYMSHGGGVEWHAPNSTTSAFYSVASPLLAVSVTNWPSNAQAYFPRFSPDGTKLAFSYLSGSSIVCSTNATGSCTGNPRKLSSDSSMDRMVVMDFSCTTPPCTSSSSGFKVTNARDMTPTISDRVSRPSFSPAGKILAYQRQLRSSKSILSWAASDVGSIAGAQAEIWGSPVPADGSTAAVPTRFNALNGLDSSGTTYLPQRARSLIDDARPLYNYRIMRHEMSQTGAAGVPAVVLSGEPTGTWNLKFDIIAGGARGTATFKYSTDGGATYQNTVYTTNASVAIGTTGLKAAFPTGTYNAASIYTIRTGNVHIRGTPSAASWQDVRIKIDSTGNRGTAKFKYSTDAGATFNATALTTAATVSLGTTGLIAEFDSVNYESTSWVWGALVAHYHQDDANYTLVEADDCSNNATMAGSRDNRANYFPSFAPSLVGDMAFLVFSSRRMYGNVAVEDGWDPEPTESCSTGKIPAKKLWISAVDPNVSGGTDGSKPAFYLPGQETAAGNSDGYWIGAACTAVDGACDTDEDCCNGTGTSATNQCRVTNSSVFPPTKACKEKNSCASTGQSCSTTANCCQGLLCPSDGGLCYQEPPLIFETQTLTRNYTAACMDDTSPVWRFFEWQATMPSGTNIEVLIQTRDKSSESWEPGAPLLAATITQTTTGTQWLRGTLPNNILFKQNGIGDFNQLLVTLRFNPNSSGTLAPTLHKWRQIVDCVDGE